MYIQLLFDFMFVDDELWRQIAEDDFALHWSSLEGTL